MGARNKIGFGEIQVWRIGLDLPVSEVRQFEPLLSRDELARADRFVTQELRSRYVVARGMLRRRLSNATGVEAADLRFEYEQWGKPQLNTKDRLRYGVHFNVSHSADQALIALASMPIGVDIELPNERINYRSIASQVLSQDEVSSWQEIPARFQVQAMLELWVCKEALLKAMGLGIAEGLKKTTFPLPIPKEGGTFHPERIDPTLQLHLEESGDCRRHDWLSAHSWHLRLLEGMGSAVAAYASLGPCRNLVLHK